jgi:hypothetical protein
MTKEEIMDLVERLRLAGVRSFRGEGLELSFGEAPVQRRATQSRRDLSTPPETLGLGESIPLPDEEGGPTEAS